MKGKSCVIKFGPAGTMASLMHLAALTMVVVLCSCIRSDPKRTILELTYNIAISGHSAGM